MFNIDERGNITCTQGDSGEVVINGLPTDKNYQVYFAIQNEKRQPVGSEIMVNSNGASSATFVLSADLTDLLTVPRNEETATYYYGIKLCHEGTGLEDTLILGTQSDGERATITAYPKQVEGLEG